MLLDLLQPIQPIIDLQVNLRPLEIIANDSSFWVTFDMEDGHFGDHGHGGGVILGDHVECLPQ